MLVVACISSHGFGHGARVAALLQAVAQQQPHCRFVLSTALPVAFLRRTFVGLRYEHRPCQWDVGVIQADALGSDPAATVAELETLEQRLPALLESEARWLEQWRQPHEAALILADVPPAAAALAKRLNWPLLWHSNFGWDSIYGALGGELAQWGEHSLAAYREGDALLRCPFALPMPWGLPCHDLGLGCGVPRWSVEALQQRLSWRTLRQRSALLCFGGLGLPFDPALLQRWPDWHFLVMQPQLAQTSNVTVLPEELRPLDVMPLCGLVITKPGYSTFCEALSQDCGLLVVERQDFAEAQVLQEGLRRHGRHRLISRTCFELGAWQLDSPLTAPSASPLPSDGAVAGAAWLLQMLQISD